MGNLTVRAGVMVLLVACGGEEARPDPTANQGGAGPTSAATTDATSTITSATTDAASSADTTATSTGATLPGEEVDGTRIKIRYLVGDDGMKSKVGYFDTQLNVPCNFERVGNDMRCLPVTQRVQGTFFADAACSVPIVLLGCNDPPATHARDGSGCDSTYFELGPELNTMYLGDPCTQSPLPGGERGFPVGAEVPVSSFARATVQ